jgi:nitrite reductase/ring-hydroxylating ferredoxin subunit/uncharacterized membrane protein
MVYSQHLLALDQALEDAVFPALKHFIDQQSWLDTVGDPLQKYVTSLFSEGGETGKQVKNFLNGTWLGHPAHPMITDVPVGAWTATVALDALASLNDDEGMARAADVTLAVGWLAALGAAATGFTDWSDTYGRERKVGLLHGLTMVASFVTYTLSLLARLGGNRAAGVGLANTGFALMSAGAYLGGDEVFDIGYGVNHTAFTHGPSDYVPVLPETELEPGKPAKADAKGVAVMLAKVDGQVYALDDTCVHAGCSLAGGKVEGMSVICPCHGSQYDLRDGSVINGPATMPEPHYAVRINNGMVEVRLAE